MTTLRYWFRLVKAFAIHFRLIIFFGVIAGLIIFVLARFLIPRLNWRSEVIGVTGRYHTDELPVEILSLIGEGLTKLDKSGQPIPAIAQKWEFKEDGKVWVFTIKEGLTWQDGTPVTAANIRYSFEDAQVEVEGTNTIIFKLASPFSPFPSVVSKPTFKRGLLGTGEWRVERVSLTSSFVEQLELVHESGKRKLYKFYPTEERTKVAYQLGEVDIIEDLFDTSPFDSWSTAEISPMANKNRFVGIFFNNDAPPFRDNKPLRQALSYAVDKETFGERALSPLSPDSWGYNPQVKEYKYDKARAIELLSELPEEQRKDLSITLTTTPTLLSTAESVAKFWNEIGVSTQVQIVPLLPQDFQAFLAIYDIPRDPDQYSTWHSTQTNTNISKYQSPRVDKLLEDGRLQLDHEARKKIYLDFQRFLLEDAPAIFLYHPLSYRVARK